MSFNVMSDVPNPIIVDAAGTAGSGYVLKAFLPGGTINTSIFIDSNGSSPQATITANSEGKWEVTGNEILPYIDRIHKWGIFANASDAAANSPFYMGPFDNVPQYLLTDGASTNELTITTMANNSAYSTVDVGKITVTTKERSTGKGGGGTHDIILTGTTANVDLPDTRRIVVSAVNSAISFVLRTGRVLFPAQWGAFADGDPVGITGTGTDNGLTLQAMHDYLNDVFNVGNFTGGALVELDGGTYETTTGLTLYPNVGMRGVGIDATEFQNQAGNSSAYTMIDVPDRGVDSNERINRNILLSSFSVNGNDNNTTGNVKNVVYDNCIYCIFDNMELKQSEDDNLTFKDCSNMLFGTVLVRDGNNSQVVLDGLTNTTFGSSVTIRTGNDWGVYFPETAAISNRVSFIGTRFASSQQGGIRCDNASTNITVKADFVEGGSNTFGADSAAIRVTNQNADGWKISSVFTRIFGKAIHCENDNVIIESNFINACRYSAIISTGADGVVTNNDVIDAGYAPFDNGTHDGSDNVAVLTDTTQAFTINEFVGFLISNLTDGSTAIVTANDATTVTGVLSGGTDNDWDIGDDYTISNFSGISVSGIRTETNNNTVKFVNDILSNGQKLLNGLIMDTGSNNGRAHSNTIGSNAAENSLVINESSVVSYKNKGAPAQLAFVIAAMSGDQVIAGSATTTVDFDVETKDVQGDYDPTTQTFTSPADGFYQINCTADTESVNASTTSVFLQADNVTDGGVMSLFNIQPGAFEGTMVLQGKIFLNKGDLFRVRIQFAGGDGTVNDRSYLQIERADI